MESRSALERAEDRIAELEIQVEEMERTNSAVLGVFVGILFAWSDANTLLAVGAGVVAAFSYWKVLACRPFTDGLRQSPS